MMNKSSIFWVTFSYAHVGTILKDILGTIFSIAVVNYEL